MQKSWISATDVHEEGTFWLPKFSRFSWPTLQIKLHSNWSKEYRAVLLSQTELHSELSLVDRSTTYKSSYILIGRKNIEQYYCRKQNYILSSHWLIDPRLNEFTILINFYLAWILLSTISGSVLSSHWLIDPRLNEFTILINFYLAWILLSTISGSVWSLSLCIRQGDIKDSVLRSGNQ